MARIFIALLLMQGFFALPATANLSALYEVVGGDASFFIPRKSETVDVLSEVLTYDIELFAEEKRAEAQVSANYELRSSITQTLLVAFVSNGRSHVPEVFLDGENLAILETRTIKWPEHVDRQNDWDANLISWTEYGRWEPTFKRILFLMNGEFNVDTNVETPYTLTVTLFELPLPENEPVRLLVSYTEQAARVKKLTGLSPLRPYYEFYYFLEPAQYWNSFSDLTININCNGTLDRDETSLPGFERGADAKYTAHFDELPEKNLRIVVRAPVSLSQLAAFSGLVALLSGAAVLAVVRRKRKRKKAAE